MNLPATTEQAKQQYEPAAQGFNDAVDALQRRPLTQQTRAIAVTLDTKAKRFQQQLEAARQKLKQPILEAARELDAFFKVMGYPAEAARLNCARIIASIDKAEQKAIAEKAAREAVEALERAKVEKVREVEMLLTQAAETGDETLVQAAEQAEAAPIEPTVVKPEEYKPAAAGYSTREVKVGMVKDAYELLDWLTDSSERFDAMSDLVEIKMTKLNAYLNKGVKFPPNAVEVMTDTKSRNASRE